MEKAYIDEIINSYSYKIRIPRFNKISSSNTATKDLSIAYVCALPGCIPTYEVDDLVLVEFENNLYDKPIIVGKYFVEPDNKSLLTLSDNIILSDNVIQQSQIYPDYEARFQLIEQRLTKLEEENELLKAILEEKNGGKS